MAGRSKAKSQLDDEIEEIDDAIYEYHQKIRNLSERRCELLAQKENADMQDVLDYLTEKGITPREALQILAVKDSS